MKSGNPARMLALAVAAALLLAASVNAQQFHNGREGNDPDGKAQGAAFTRGNGGEFKCRYDNWIETSKQEPAGTHYKLFATPSRGPNTEASYLIYLPPDYDTATNRHYPVLYWLHGGGGDQLSGAALVERIDKQIRDGKLTPFIVVLPQAVSDVRYVNSKDGKAPLEDVLIKDLVPHIDATYRTINDRKARGIEGFSMGGFGSLRLGFKFTSLFGAVSGLAPSITEMKDEPACVVAPYAGDQAYYDESGPWNQLRVNADQVRGKTNVRLLVGEKDQLMPLVEKYEALLTELKIDHQFALSAPNVDHRYTLILDRAPYDALRFWREAWGRLGY